MYQYCLGLILSALVTNQLYAQNKFTLGVYPGYACTYHAFCSLSDKSIHRGSAATLSFRLGYNLGDRFRLQFVSKYEGIGASNYFEQTIDFQFLLRFYFFKPEKTGDFRFFFETGAGLAMQSGFHIPTLIGCEYNFNDRFALNINAQIPLLQLTNTSFGDLYFTTFTGEVGLVYTLGRKTKSRRFINGFDNRKMKHSKWSSRNPRFL